MFRNILSRVVSTEPDAPTTINMSIEPDLARPEDANARWKGTLIKISIPFFWGYYDIFIARRSGRLSKEQESPTRKHWEAA